MITALVILLCQSAHAQIWTYVEPYNSNCNVGQPCQVGAIHTIRIVNDTPQPQSYHWVFAIKADNGDNVSQGNFITLQPGEEFRKDKIANIGYMKFNIRGHKLLHCTTQADGYEHGIIAKDGYAEVR